MEFRAVSIAQFEWNGQIATVRRSLVDAKEILDITYKVFLLNPKGDKVERRFVVEKTLQIEKEGEAQAKELEALKARPAALSPAAAALAGFVNQKGMRGQDFDRECRKARGGELRPVVCWGLGGVTWSVLVLEVSNTGGEPWTPAWAEVTPAAGGEPRRARLVLPVQATIPPGGVVSMAVEVEMPKREEPEEWLSALHTVRVCNGDGSRCLSVPEVKL
jgi:hypothetical protein